MHPDEKKERWTTYDETAAMPTERTISEADMWRALVDFASLFTRWAVQQTRRAEREERVRKASQQLNEAVRDLHQQ